MRDGERRGKDIKNVIKNKILNEKERKKIDDRIISIEYLQNEKLRAKRV